MVCWPPLENSRTRITITYITGAQYEYHFEDLNDPELKRMNCTIIDTIQLNTTNSTNYRGYMYNCFKQDFNFGIGTLMIMFGPGFLLSVLWAWGLRNSGIASCIFIIASPVISGLYPILLFCVKVSLLVHVIWTECWMSKLLLNKQNSYIGQSWFSEWPDYSCQLVW